MSNFSLLQFLLKSIIFILIVFIGIVIIREVSKPNNEIKRFGEIVGELSDNSIVFIGSSRVARGIDPNILVNVFPKYSFVNLGISGGTFLNNYLITDHLIKTSKAGLFLIELSPLIADFNLFNSKNINELGISINTQLTAPNYDDKFSAARLLVDVQNSILLNKLSLREEVKSLITVSFSKQKPKFGYFSEQGNDVLDNSSILTPKDLKENNIPFEPSNCYSLITQLIETSKKYNKKVIFTLPLTYEKQQEKRIVIPIYFHLSDSLKLTLDQEFLTRINHKEYLRDKNHFNQKGSEVFSKEMARLMKAQVFTSPPTQ